MKIIKLGGTALQTPTLVNNAIKIIKNFDEQLLVVLSAIGRKGFPYATDTLIDSIKEKFISSKEMDRLLSIGEIYSTIFLSNELNKNDVKAYSLSYRELGILCDNNYLDGNVIGVKNDKIKSLLSKNQVLLIPGFIASSSEKEVITLGRSSSDYSAVLLASIFNEKEVILYKDVDGIYPTIQYPMTKLINYSILSFDEAILLCDIGYNIVNKKALVEAKKNSINIIIKNYIENDKYTLISSEGSNKKIVGFNIEHNTYFIATLNGEEVLKELNDIFLKHHIFVKNIIYERNVITFNFIASQGLLIRQLILLNFFKEMMKK